MCAKCCDPGHIRKHCKLNYDSCRRCGSDRSNGEHSECIAKCHRYQQNHFSTDYRCQFLIDYRRALLNELEEKPNLFPPNVRIFIPFDCRDRGGQENKILSNPTRTNCNPHPKNGRHIPTFELQSHTWPDLTSTITRG